MKMPPARPEQARSRRVRKRREGAWRNWERAHARDTAGCHLRWAFAVYDQLLDRKSGLVKKMMLVGLNGVESDALAAIRKELVPKMPLQKKDLYR